MGNIVSIEAREGDSVGLVGPGAITSLEAGLSATLERITGPASYIDLIDLHAKLREISEKIEKREPLSVADRLLTRYIAANGIHLPQDPVPSPENG